MGNDLRELYEWVVAFPPLVKFGVILVLIVFLFLLGRIFGVAVDLIRDRMRK